MIYSDTSQRKFLESCNDTNRTSRFYIILSCLVVPWVCLLYKVHWSTQIRLVNLSQTCQSSYKSFQEWTGYWWYVLVPRIGETEAGRSWTEGSPEPLVRFCLNTSKQVFKDVYNSICPSVFLEHLWGSKEEKCQMYVCVRRHQRSSWEETPHATAHLPQFCLLGELLV